MAVSEGPGAKTPRAQRILLVSRSYQSPPIPLREVIEVGEQNQVEVIFCALGTYCRRNEKQPLTEEMIFSGTKYLRVMMLETAKNLAKEVDQRIEVWERGRKPLHIKREFARSCEAKASKLRFMSLFNERQFNFVDGEADSFMVNCGEQAIITLQRGDRSVRDDFGFLKQLNAQRNIRFIWNPSHTAFGRHECTVKKRIFSKKAEKQSPSGRACLAVWNHDSRLKRQPNKRWQVFVSDKDLSDKVREIPHKIRDDIKLGMIEL